MRPEPVAWSEERIEASPTGATEPGASVAQGHSVLVVDGFASASEVARLKKAATAAAARHLDACSRTKTDPAAKLRFHVHTELDAPARDITDELVRRALAFVRRSLPEMGQTMLCCRASELCELPRAPGLEFSPGEPAINVYAPGGEFRAHEDQMNLTVLIPLSTAGDFSGGGTAFWKRELHDDARKGTAPPTLELAPPAGSALLFAGTVTHAGQPVKTGERIVWVASFSPRKGGAKLEADVDLEAILGLSEVGIG